MAIKLFRRSGPRIPLGAGRILILVAATTALTSLGLYQVWSQYQVVQVAYNLDDQRFEHRRLMETQKRLTLGLSTYRDPAAVRAFAEDILEMHLPRRNDELFVPGQVKAPVRRFKNAPSLLPADLPTGLLVARSAGSLPSAFLPTSVPLSVPNPDDGVSP